MGDVPPASLFAKYGSCGLYFAIPEYGNEVARLHRAPGKRLPGSAYLYGPEYTIARIRTFPGIRTLERRGIDLAHYRGVQPWHDAIAACPAIRRGIVVLAERQRRGSMAGAGRGIMSGKTKIAAR